MDSKSKYLTGNWNWGKTMTPRKRTTKKKSPRTQIKELRQINKAAQEQIQILQNQLRVTITDKENWRTKAQYRIDENMMKERIELASKLGQMIEATSKAIMFIVAKEAI